MNPSSIVTLPVRLAARGVGLVRGTVAEGARLAQGRPSGTPVNVTEELGLATAPPDRPRERRAPAVTSIDQQAEPGLVVSTPADVAARIHRSDDADD